MNFKEPSTLAEFDERIAEYQLYPDEAKALDRAEGLLSMAQSAEKSHREEAERLNGLASSIEDAQASAPKIIAERVTSIDRLMLLAAGVDLHVGLRLAKFDDATAAIEMWAKTASARAAAVRTAYRRSATRASEAGQLCSRLDREVQDLRKQVAALFPPVTPGYSR